MQQLHCGTTALIYRGALSWGFYRAGRGDQSRNQLYVTGEWSWGRRKAGWMGLGGAFAVRREKSQRGLVWKRFGDIDAQLRSCAAGQLGLQALGGGGVSRGTADEGGDDSSLGCG